MRLLPLAALRHDREQIFAIEFVRVFLTVYVYSDTKVGQILTMYRKQSVESKTVELCCSTSNGF